MTPQYFMFGDTGRVLRPEEVELIATRTDFLCIEKSHGSRQLGFAELGARHEAAAFKKIKPEMKVLFYFNSAYAWPFTSYHQMFKWGKIDEHPELNRTRNRSERMAALAKERVGFYLACYLIGAQPYSYFQFGWGWTLSSGALHDYPASCTNRSVLPRGLISEGTRKDGNLPVNLNTPAFG